MSIPRLLTAKEFAERTGFCTKTVKKWARERLIKGSRRIGRDWRFTEDAVDELMSTKSRLKTA